MCLVIASFLAWQPGARLPLGVSLSLVAATNSLATSASRIYVVSNCFPRRILYRSGLPQAKSNGVWPSEVTLGPAMGFLNPGQSATFAVTALTNGGSWRLPVIWGRYSRGAEHWFEFRQWVANRLHRPPPVAAVLHTNFTEEASQ
jgi:hypothetical protein